MREVRISVLHAHGSLAVAAATQPEEGRCVAAAQAGAVQLEVDCVPHAVLQTVSHALLQPASPATSQETRSLEGGELGLDLRVAATL